MKTEQKPKCLLTVNNFLYPNFNGFAEEIQRRIPIAVGISFARILNTCTAQHKKETISKIKR